MRRNYVSGRYYLLLFCKSNFSFIVFILENTSLATDCPCRYWQYFRLPVFKRGHFGDNRHWELRLPIWIHAPRRLYRENVRNDVL